MVSQRCKMIVKDELKNLGIQFVSVDLGIIEINDEFKFDSVEELKELSGALDELEKDYQIYKTNKNKYMLLENSNLKIGTFLGTRKNFGFVDIEGNDDVFISPTAINGALNKDTVVVEITSKKGTELEGRILKVIDRKIEKLVGEVQMVDNKKTVILDDNKVKINIVLDEDKSLGAMPGHKVYIKLLNKLNNTTYKAEVLEILGHKEDPGVDILSIVYKYDIPTEFPLEVEEELNIIPNEVSQEEISTRLNNGGLDLRDTTIFTIDGDDTKDIDDAVAVRKLENGNYELGVHIADVSYYVKKGSKLEQEAFNRGNSVYLADRVIPMLPHKLSNGICSLNPNVDRLAMSCIMEINPNGDIISYDIKESVIRSRIQMTYKKVNSIIEKNIVPDGYEAYADDLRLMEELAAILRANKIKRGYIDFDIDESKIIVNDKAEVIDIVLRERGMGEKLIEDFMIAANEAVATCIFFMDLPFLYRVHGEPKEEKIQNFITFVHGLGYQITGKMTDMHPKEMQKILDSLKDKKEFHILSSLLLRSMQKAIYDKKNIGHFGLASKCYTHFTSPIRRYSDTTVHRLLRKYLFEKNYTKEFLELTSNELVLIGQQTSERERAAIGCEREVDDMKKAEYMEKHIGEEYVGMISSITSFGMFIELPNLIEGLIKLDLLRDDYYEFDEATISLIGKRHNRQYHLGDSINVRCIGASKATKTVDFEPVKPIKDESKEVVKVENK